MAKKAAKATRKQAKTSSAARKPAAKKSAAAKPSRSTSAKPAKPPAPKKPARSAKPPAAAETRPPAPSKPVSSGLTREDLDYFREQLLRKKAEITGSMQSLRNETGSTSQEAAGNLSAVPQHMADIGSDNYEQEFALVLVEGERALLSEIDDALKRIDKGVYGICAATGKPIGKARLKAKPWAAFCYEYVLARETGRGQR